MRTLRFSPPAAATVLALFLSALPPARAEVRLPKVFGSRMVLQQDQPLTFWGWAEPNETVTVKAGPESRQAKANERGEWKAILPALKAGGPHTVTVRGSSTVTFEDVLVGEVWLCASTRTSRAGIPDPFPEA